MCYGSSMKSALKETPIVVPLDEEHARMMAYGQSSDGKKRIEEAEAEIAAERGIVADAAYFASLKKRRVKARVRAE